MLNEKVAKHRKANHQHKCIKTCEKLRNPTTSTRRRRAVIMTKNDAPRVKKCIMTKCDEVKVKLVQTSAPTKAPTKKATPAPAPVDMPAARSDGNGRRLLDHVNQAEPKQAQFTQAKPARKSAKSLGESVEGRLRRRRRRRPRRYRNPFQGVINENRAKHHKAHKCVKSCESPGRLCAQEGRTCSCRGVVSYGRDRQWKTKHFTKATSFNCNNHVFGDPQKERRRQGRRGRRGRGSNRKSCFCKQDATRRRRNFKCAPDTASLATSSTSKGAVVPEVKAGMDPSMEKSEKEYCREASSPGKDLTICLDHVNEMFGVMKKDPLMKKTAEKVTEKQCKVAEASEIVASAVKGEQGAKVGAMQAKTATETLERRKKEQLTRMTRDVAQLEEKSTKAAETKAKSDKNLQAQRLKMELEQKESSKQRKTLNKEKAEKAVKRKAAQEKKAAERKPKEKVNKEKAEKAVKRKAEQQEKKAAEAKPKEKVNKEKAEKREAELKEKAAEKKPKEREGKAARAKSQKAGDAEKAVKKSEAKDKANRKKSKEKYAKARKKENTAKVKNEKAKKKEGAKKTAEKKEKPKEKARKVKAAVAAVKEKSEKIRLSELKTKKERAIKLQKERKLAAALKKKENDRKAKKMAAVQKEKQYKIQANEKRLKVPPNIVGWELKATEDMGRFEEKHLEKMRALYHSTETFENKSIVNKKTYPTEKNYITHSKKAWKKKYPQAKEQMFKAMKAKQLRKESDKKFKIKEEEKDKKQKEKQKESEVKLASQPDGPAKQRAQKELAQQAADDKDKKMLWKKYLDKVAKMAKTAKKKAKTAKKKAKTAKKKAKTVTIKAVTKAVADVKAEQQNSDECIREMKKKEDEVTQIDIKIASLKTDMAVKVWSTVSLAGITTSQFDAATQTSFKRGVADGVKKRHAVCGATGARVCSSRDISISSTSEEPGEAGDHKKAVKVKFSIATPTASASGNAVVALQKGLDGNEFTKTLNQQGGTLAKVTGTTVLTPPKADKSEKIAKDSVERINDQIAVLSTERVALKKSLTKTSIKESKAKKAITVATHTARQNRNAVFAAKVAVQEKRLAVAMSPVNLTEAMNPPSMPNLGRVAFAASLAKDPIKKKLAEEFKTHTADWEAIYPKEMINPGDQTSRIKGQGLRDIVEHHRKKLRRTGRILLDGWAAWTAVGRPVGGPSEDYECRAPFLVGMAVLDPRNSTVKATIDPSKYPRCYPEMYPRAPNNVSSNISRGWGIATKFDVGCSCNKVFAGTSPKGISEGAVFAATVRGKKFWKILVKGPMDKDHIIAACNAHGMKPVCEGYRWNDKHCLHAKHYMHYSNPLFLSQHQLIPKSKAQNVFWYTGDNDKSDGNTGSLYNNGRGHRWRNLRDKNSYTMCAEVPAMRNAGGVVLKMIFDGQMPNKMASFCSGRMAQWSNEAWQRFQDIEKAEDCAAAIVVACSKACRGEGTQGNAEEAAVAKLTRMADAEEKAAKPLSEKEQMDEAKLTAKIAKQAADQVKKDAAGGGSKPGLAKMLLEAREQSRVREAAAEYYQDVTAASLEGEAVYT